MVKIIPHRPVYWECTIDGHKKFWAAQIMEIKKKAVGMYLPPSTWLLVRKWGMIGTEGQKMEQSYDSTYEAENALEKLIREKESKGYKAIF